MELRKADRQHEDLATRGKTSKIEWEDEVADVFSWLTAVYLHLRGVVRDLEPLIEAFGAPSGPEDPQRARLTGC